MSIIQLFELPTQYSRQITISDINITDTI